MSPRAIAPVAQKAVRRNYSAFRSLYGTVSRWRRVNHYLVQMSLHEHRIPPPSRLVVRMVCNASGLEAHGANVSDANHQQWQNRATYQRLSPKLLKSD
jgi:hypothetical protein